MSHRVRESEEKVETLLCRLNDCKQSKEEIYEQMVKQRYEKEWTGVHVQCMYVSRFKIVLHYSIYNETSKYCMVGNFVGY